MDSLQSNSMTARIAAALYFFVCIPLYFWEQNYAGGIFVAQDPVATANNLLANEFVFRAATVTHMLGTVVFVFIILMFYRLLRPVDRHLSRTMLVAVLAQIPVVLVLEVLNIAALMTLKSEPRPTFDVVQQQEVAYFLLRLHRYGLGTGKLFLGLSFIPLGMLLLKSGFAPRIIGAFFIIGGISYVADFCIYVLLQRPDYLLVRSFLIYTHMVWMLSLLWFLVKGVRQPASTAVTDPA